MKLRALSPIIIGLMTLFASDAYANCESCFLPRIERDTSYSLGADKEGYFVDFRYEYQNWDTQTTESDGHASKEESEHHESAETVSNSGEQDSQEEHGHNRSMERFYHLSAGVNLSQSLSVLAHVPFVERFDKRESSVENSEGIGDASLIGNWRFLRGEKGYLGALMGIKFPTGSTSQRDSDDIRFEPELQPGTGSTDVTLGLTYQYNLEPLILRGNAIHIFRSEGAQDYQFGDASSFSLFIDTPIQREANISSFIGLDINLQYGEKDSQNSDTVISSGGTILLVGPNLTVKFSDDILLSAAVLFPAIQDRGGDHQDLSSIVTAGARVLF